MSGLEKFFLVIFNIICLCAMIALFVFAWPLLLGGLAVIAVVGYAGTNKS